MTPKVRKQLRIHQYPSLITAKFLFCPIGVPLSVIVLAQVNHAK